MFHANQYQDEEQDWWINWFSIMGEPTGMSLSSSEWQAVGTTGMSFMDAGIQDGWAASVRASGGDPDTIYVIKNLVTIETDDGPQIREERIEFYILSPE